MLENGSKINVPVLACEDACLYSIEPQGHSPEGEWLYQHMNAMLYVFYIPQGCGRMCIAIATLAASVNTRPSAS